MHNNSKLSIKGSSKNYFFTQLFNKVSFQQNMDFKLVLVLFLAAFVGSATAGGSKDICAASATCKSNVKSLNYLQLFFLSTQALWDQLEGNVPSVAVDMSTPIRTAALINRNTREPLLTDSSVPLKLVTIVKHPSAMARTGNALNPAKAKLNYIRQTLTLSCNNLNMD